jgi:predicted metal-dependent phosphoesterase TrpH
VIVDFHSHTYESDGSLAPAQLVDLMRKAGVRIFAITDHDTTRAYGQFEADFARVVPGVEINTSWRDNEVHVLGYGIPTGDAGPLAAVLAANRDFRRTRADLMVTAVNAAGFPVTREAVIAEAGSADAIGRPHLAKALVRAGLVSDIDAAFRTLLGRGKPGYIPSNNITPAEAIAAIADAGGIPVLAHPGRLKDETILDELAPQGLAGLEVFYPTHSPSQTAHFRSKAAHYGLVMTAGSDFHDARWNGRGVGMDVDEDDIGPFLELVGTTA